VLELAWFLAGAAVTAIAFVAMRAAARRRVRQALSARADATPASGQSRSGEQRSPEPAVEKPLVERRRRGDFRSNLSVDARRLALTLADELANQISGVEGRAHHLIVSGPSRSQLPVAAEGMQGAIKRLRTLHSKILTLAGVRPAETGHTELDDAIEQLREGLQQLQLGLEVRWHPTAKLPAAAVEEQVVRDVLIFLGCALLRAERGATLLTIHCERCFADREPRVQIELMLEWVTSATQPRDDALQDTSFALDFEAAFQLVTQSSGDLQVAHLPGRSVRAVVRWPISTAAPVSLTLPEPAEPKSSPLTPPLTEPRHSFGGALILESDPAVRAMLSSELKATGRAVFACSDGAAARTFLLATPERFELLIVDAADRLTGDDDLRNTIRTTAPALKVVVLTPGPDAGPHRWPNARHLQKPFGVHDLRRALASLSPAG
jgi:hypothetical protein